jgi:hypothetical protein
MRDRVTDEHETPREAAGVHAVRAGSTSNTRRSPDAVPRTWRDSPRGPRRTDRIRPLGRPCRCRTW